MDWGPIEVCGSPQSYVNLAEGRHEFAVRARDAANNESGFRTYSWTIDVTPPPAPAITTAPPAAVRSGEATFAFSGSERGAEIRCRLDTTPFAPCSSPMRFSNLAEGAHSFTVTARDAAGNESGATYGWRVDTTPPAVAFTTRPADPSRFRDAVFAFGADETASFRCKLNDEAFSACASPRTYPGLAETSHTFTIVAHDAAGNESTWTVKWRIDATPPPMASLVSFPENPTADRQATFAFTSAEAGVGYRCQLDSAAFAACSTPFTYSNVADGAHRLEIRAVDAAGNESAPRVHRWIVNNTPPPGLGLDLGVYIAGGPTGADRFEAWLNRPVTRVLEYIPGTSWATIADPAQVVSRWQNSGYKVVYSTPLLPSTGGTLEEGARGTYDAHFTALAQTLARFGQGDAVIRLGWEFNGNWFPWGAYGKTAEFKTFWRRIVTAMRAVSPRFKFDWNPAYGPLLLDASDAYPGDAWVDYIGLSVFDQGWEPGYDNHILRWRNFINLPFAMQWHRDFAIEHGKPMTYPEWGLTFRDDYPGHGGGDNPYYVEKMYRWLNANPVAYAIYFEYDTGPTRHSMMAGSFPDAARVFRQLFGQP